MASPFPCDDPACRLAAQRKGARRCASSLPAAPGSSGRTSSTRTSRPGHEVLVIDSLWEHGGGRRANVPEGVSLVHMDIRDEAIGRIFAEFKPEVVSHHAAQHSVAISARDPDLRRASQRRRLAQRARARATPGARKVIFASSGATFGTPERLPITDATPQRPTSPYGITKMVARALSALLRGLARISILPRCATATSTVRAKIPTARPA